MMRDVVIIGGGHNGLVAAALLGKAGLKPLVLEQADQVGGCIRTMEIAPGFRCPSLAHRASIDPHLVQTLELQRHGLQIIRPDAVVCSPTTEGRALTIWADRSRTVREIAAFSANDAERYPHFLESIAGAGAVLRALAAKRPPDLDRLSMADAVPLLQAGRRFRALQRPDAYRLLRWLPMSMADFVDEWFTGEPLRSTVAASGLLGSFVGPRSAGSAAAFLWLAAQEGHPVAPGWTARGGISAVTSALAAAARQHGAEIRVGSEVRQIVVEAGSATGVVLATGEQIAARQIVSNADPRRTLLGLIRLSCLPSSCGLCGTSGCAARSPRSTTPCRLCRRSAGSTSPPPRLRQPFPA
jgi:phytoene dehydrogenase-like protein